MSAACSGWRSAANRNREWIAARRALRVRALLRAVVFEVVEERRDQRRVEVGDVERRAGLPVRCAVKTSSSRSVLR